MRKITINPSTYQHYIKLRETNTNLATLHQYKVHLIFRFSKENATVIFQTEKKITTNARKKATILNKSNGLGTVKLPFFIQEYNDGKNKIKSRWSGPFQQLPTHLETNINDPAANPDE